jgi:hypothetical protein
VGEVKSILKLLFAILIASSPAFFILVGNAGEVEAKTCGVGEFPHLKEDGTTKCENATSSDNTNEQITGIKGYIFKFVKIVMVFSSSLVALVITYSGFLYTNSEGDPRKVEAAKVMMIRAGIGILVITSSFAIMNFITQAAGLNFNV